MSQHAGNSYLQLRFAISILVCALVATGIRAELKFSEWLQDKQGSSLLGGNETSLAISPDGRNLYAAGRSKDAVVVFGRDTATGAVHVHSLAQEGVDGLTGLLQPASVVVSPNGKFVYVAAIGSSSITVFNREPDGGLALNRKYNHSDPDYAALKYPYKIYLAPDGKIMLVYTQGAIKPRLLRIDTATGLFVSDYRVYNYAWESLTSDADLVISRSGRYVYTVERAIAKVVVNTLDSLRVGEIGEAWKVGVPETIIGGPKRVAVSPDEKFLYISTQTSPAILIQEKDDRTWNYAFKDSILYGKERSWDNQRAPLMLMSEDGGQLYVSQSDDAFITVFTRDALSGGLTRSGKVPLFLEPGTVNPEGALSMVASPDGKNLYVLPHWSHSLQAYKRNPADGMLEPLFSLNVGKTGIEGLQRPAGLAITHDGRHVFSLPGNRDAVVCFVRDPQNGRLAWVSTSQVAINPLANSSYSDGGHVERHAVLSPDGRHLYEARPHEFAMATYALDPSCAAALADAMTYQAPEDAKMHSDAYLAPDGKALFASDLRDTILTSWKRDPGTGKLTFLSAHRNVAGSKGFEGMKGRNGLIGDKGNRFLYLASLGERAVTVFIRHSVDSLEWLQTEKYPLPESHGGEPFSFLALSPGGENLYVAEKDGYVVQVFERDTASGKLKFLETMKPDSAQYKGMAGITGMAMSPDGSAVYITGRHYHALTALRRDEKTGKLSFWKSFFDGQDGVGGLFNAGGLAVSPEGRHVYVTSREDNAMAIFQNDSIPPAAIFSKGGKLNRLSLPSVLVHGNRLRLEGLKAGAFQATVLNLDGRKVLAATGWANASGRADLAFREYPRSSLFLLQVRQGNTVRSHRLFMASR